MKRVKMRMSHELLAQVLQGKIFQEKVKTNAPKDLRVVGIEQDTDGFFDGYVWIYMESEEFEEKPEGGRSPEIKAFIYEKA